MQIQKSQLVDFLKQHGQGDKAQLVQDRLPDTIDLDQYAGFLREHGIDPGNLLQGGLGDLGKRFGL